MPQPLFMEVTDQRTRETRIVGLAWISDIVRDNDDGGTGAVIFTSKGSFTTVETYELIKHTLGVMGAN